jgi:hypothetical protein
MAHSCVTVPLETLFARSTPAARAAFETYVALIERCCHVEVIGQETRIVVMGRVRFAGAKVLRDRVRLSIALTRRIDAPWVERIDTYLNGRWNSYHFEVRSPADLGAIPELPSLVCEEYHELGMQGALGRTAGARSDRIEPD